MSSMRDTCSLEQRSSAAISLISRQYTQILPPVQRARSKIPTKLGLGTDARPLRKQAGSSEAAVARLLVDVAVALALLAVLEEARDGEDEDRVDA